MIITFEAGTSRHGDYGVYFMKSVLSSALYAEVKVPDGASKDYGYFALKGEIMRQALANGISVNSLQFWYDGQEGYLESDAHADCEVKGW